MLLIPAIDLKDGQCVRLVQGDMNQATTFGNDPAAMAQRWLDAGARHLHLVDLNGAFAGKPENREAIQAILRTVGGRVAVQLGGGIRDMDTIAAWLEAGIDDVIIGTAAIRQPGFLKDACRAFAGHIIAGLDARGGKLAVSGWGELTDHDALPTAQRFADQGVQSIIYTDIGRDGMLSGINIEATQALARAVPVPVIASGGLGGMDDIRALCKEGIHGVICGRAIYSGALDFAAAQQVADGLHPAGAAHA